MESWKSWLEGRTFCHGNLVSLVSRDRSAARRPWTVILPRGSEMVRGTVRGVRRALVGTVKRTLPAYLSLV